jgi:hypothetical protein
MAQGVQQQKGKENHRIQKQTLQNSKIQFLERFGASNLKSAFENVDFDTYDVILNTKGAQFLKMSIRQRAI